VLGATAARTRPEHVSFRSRRIISLLFSLVKDSDRALPVIIDLPSEYATVTTLPSAE
jgi:hypothetical protein